ncbi:MAG: alpha/beta hydrolase [Granulosicoccus sp.]
MPVSADHRYISYSRRYFGTQEWVDGGKEFSVDVFANDLIALIDALGLQGVHLVSWSSGVRTAIAAGIKRPDLVKSMIHFEPVEDNVFNGIQDADLKAIASEWGSRWDPVGESLQLGDEEAALSHVFEIVFEMERGGYANERELIREITRQNARTLPVNLSRYSEDNIKLTCEYISQVTAPTLFVYGEQTHEYWQIMAKRFNDCTPDSSIATIAGANHYAPIQKIEEVSDLILQFVDKNRD